MPTTADLHPSFSNLAATALEAADRFAQEHGGLRVRMTQGMRSVAAQDALYAKGRTTPGSIVTYVRGGESWHNYGLAFDIGVFSADFKQYLGSSPLYDQIGRFLADTYKDLVWGGDFPKVFGGTFRDRPHFEYHPGYTTKGGARQVIAYKDRPFDVPIVVPSNEFGDAWQKMKDLGIYTDYTEHGTIVTTDLLAVFLSRLNPPPHA